MRKNLHCDTVSLFQNYSSFYFECIGMYLNVCLCTTHILRACRGQKRESEPLKLELPEVVSPLVGAGTQIWILW